MKREHPSGILFLLLILLTGRTFCQDVIYRTNGTILNIDIVSFDGQTIKYRLPGDVSGRIVYLSPSVVDSLKYDNGETLTFRKSDPPVNGIKRNYIGTDLYNTCFGNPNISFERLSASGKTGFYVEFLYNLNIDDFYGVYNNRDFTSNGYLNYNPFYSFTKVGFSYYPFNYSLNKTGVLRMFTGASLLLGQFKKVEYFYDENYIYHDEFTKIFAAVISWNGGAKIYVADWFQIRGSAELSLIPFLVFNSLEVGITIGF